VLRDRMRVLRPKPHIEVFSHFETRPGERLEVDWCERGHVLPGVLQRVSAFVAVLPHSRMTFVTFSISHAMGPFVRGMDRCLRFFGGRASVDVFDNMKTVVTGRVRSEPNLHPTMVDYARMHGVAVSATKPRHPTGKPFVERGTGFVRSR
jgi:transposase